jgi:hypothetical protein
MTRVVVRVLPGMRQRQRQRPDVGTPTMHTESQIG